MAATTNMNNEFIDPITYDIISDPVALPCCGNIISRDSIITCLYNTTACPNCRGDLSEWDPNTAPKIRQVANIIAMLNPESHAATSTTTAHNNGGWNIELEELRLDNSTSRIGQLRIHNPDKKYIARTLLIPVVDISGSMGGNPIKQVNDCINTMVDMNYQHRNVETVIVTYDTVYTCIPIDLSKPRVENQHTLLVRGGTSFKAAFDGIINVINKHKDRAEITSIVVVFLTDGEDSSVAKNNRSSLVSEFNNQLNATIPNKSKDIVVHTVGFGASHDYDFLNSLRNAGTQEGAYRYADPREDGDALYTKITGVISAVFNTSGLNLEIKELPAKLVMIDPVCGTSGKYWINMAGFQPIELASQPIKFCLKTSDAGQPDIEAKINLSGKHTENVINDWYSYLIDKIASEVSDINNSTANSTARQLHLTLLQLRIKSICSKLEPDTALRTRASILADNINVLATGGKIDSQKLNDLKFESQFGGGSRKAWIPPTQSIGNSITRLATESVSGYQQRAKLWSTAITTKQYRVLIRKQSCVNDVIRLVSLGRLRAMESTRDSFVQPALLSIDSHGFGLMDTAIACGNWKMVKYLADTFNIKPVNCEQSVIMAIHSGYHKTAKLVCERGWWKPTEEHIKTAPNSTCLDALRSINETECTVDIKTAVINGMIKEVTNAINAASASVATTLSWREFITILHKPTNEQQLCIIKLLQAGWLRPDEEMELQVSDDNGDRLEILTPAFIACEKGNLTLFNALVKHGALSTPAAVNWQNRLGTSLLWIAACNKHIDIVCSLINMGADVNLANHKGNPPLVPACQKGAANIVSILMASGARLDTYNKNRDGPVLICCRNGQAEILDMLLSSLTPEECQQQISTWAEIDGFPPLMAAIELDKVDAARVCIKYGASVDWMTAMDNPVIKGANVLHLAAFYGRIASVKFLIKEQGMDALVPCKLDGKTALHIAISKGFADIARYLIELPNIGKQALKQMDADGRLPIYYASMAGNEHIKAELFTNRLAIALAGMFLLNTKSEEAKTVETDNCQVLAKYSQSPGVFDKEEILDIRLDRGVSLLSQALLNGNTELASTLCQLGASIHTPDDYGITPEFWQHYFKVDVRQAVISSEVSEQLDRLITVSTKSLQNKMLLNLTVGIQHPETPTDKQQLTPICRLTAGFGSTVPELAVQVLDMNREMQTEYSLLGLLEKMRNQKVFPDGKQNLDHILWDARVHLVKTVATATSTKLDPIHLMAIYLYTANDFIFQKINEALIKLDEPNNIWAPCVHALYQGLYLAPCYQGEVYRPIPTRFSPAEYPIGGVLTWNSFSLASADWKTSAELINTSPDSGQTVDGRGIIFIIESNRLGRDISRYSKYPQNQEILFPPGSKFIIHRYIIANQIALAQANIRDTTFKMTDIELDKAITGRTPIIIELKELTDRL